MKNLLSKNIIPDFFLNPEYRKVRYLTSLFIMTIITISMVLNNIHYLGSTAYEVLEWVIYFVLTFGLIIANVFILVPHYLLKNRVVAYFVAAFVIIVIGLILIVYLQIFVFSGGTLIEKMGGTVIIVNCLSSLVSMGFLVTGSSAIQLLRYWIKDTRRIGELEAATLQSELDLLKSQINPHFLFNMLNNANVLIWKNKEEAQQLLYKLESLLKYQLKEATSDKILLLFDIRFLNDFLNLEKVRRDNFEFTITTEGNANEIWMPSLLFIPFVENAIKHNPDSNHLSYVYIHFKIAGRKLEFRCENSKPATKPVQKQSGGLGLKNIQRRLSLLYPGKHILDIQDEATRYTITLKLELE